MWPFKRKPESEIIRRSYTEVSRTFVALDDFDEVIGGKPQPYRRGQSYQVRPGNDELAKKVDIWAEDGLVKWGADVARVIGAGEVS
jgi:hypothetical protein